MIKYQQIILLFFVVSLAFTNTRVGFSRPGSIIRTPGQSLMVAPATLKVGSSMEILNVSTLNYSPAIYFHALNVNGYNFGLSYFSHAFSSEDDTHMPSSLSINVDKQVFNKNGMTVSVGAHDILYSAPAKHRISLFVNFSHHYTINKEYNLESTVGFGTGFLSEDSHNYNYDGGSGPANFFASLKIHTPIFKKNRGGMTILAEYERGLNVGVSIPINDDWTISAGMTHFENISKFQDWNTDGTILDDAPAIVFGFEILLPAVNYSGIKKTDIVSQQSYGFDVKNQERDSLIAHANTIISSLEDTLMLQNVEQANLEILNQSLQQKINFLSDSLKGIHLEGKIFQDNLNIAMKYLSKSLDGYYSGDYVGSLSSVDKAVEIFPDLAISYARKGSIYYKMGDNKRATINWNLALKLDPEYTEVRNILIAIKNRKVDLNKLPE